MAAVLPPWRALLDWPRIMSMPAPTRMGATRTTAFTLPAMQRRRASLPHGAQCPSKPAANPEAQAMPVGDTQPLTPKAQALLAPLNRPPRLQAHRFITCKATPPHRPLV